MLIKNIKVITPFELLIGYEVLVVDGKIKDIVPEGKYDEKEFELIDGKDNYLSPGFIDIHNHGNSGYDIMDASEKALDQMGRYHISNGVTSYLGTVITSSYDNIIKAMNNIKTYKNKKDYSRLLGVHLEGPFFNQSKKGAQPEEYIKLPDLEKIKFIIEESGERLKMVSMAPELPGALDIIEYIKSKNIAVAMAHTNASYEEAKRGIAYGGTIATHLFNGMREFNHREPGVIGAVLNDERVYCEIIYDRIHLHDGAVEIALRMKGHEKIILISDAMRAAGLEDGEYELGGQKVIVSEGAARLESGSLAGSTLNLKQAVYNMTHYLDIPIHQVVRMASLNPAKALGLNNLGSIEVGNIADLIIFDNNIDIKNVILQGNLID